MLSVHMRIIYCGNIICVFHTARFGKVLKIENSTRISRSRLFLGRLVRGLCWRCVWTRRGYMRLCRVRNRRHTTGMVIIYLGGKGMQKFSWNTWREFFRKASPLCLNILLIKLCKIKSRHRIINNLSATCSGFCKPS